VVVEAFRRAARQIAEPEFCKTVHADCFSRFCERVCWTKGASVPMIRSGRRLFFCGNFAWVLTTC
jgi:hypothetical protein